MHKNKYILFVAPRMYPCATGGLEVFNHYLIEELQKDYPIHILTKCEDVPIKGVVIHKLKEVKYPKLFVPLQIFLFIVKNRKSIKLMHLSYSKSYWTYWLVYVLTKKFFSVKYFFTIHGGGLTKWKPKLPFQLFFKHADFITGVSDRIINEYTERSEREIIYTPPLVPFKVLKRNDLNRAKYNISTNEKVLLYVGSLKPLKSVDTLIEALGQISKETLINYKIKVLIVGDGVSKNELMKRTSELSLDQNVSFLGLVSRDEIPELYSLADFYIICSEFEGLPISLLEAFANGIPSVSSDAPGLINVSENNSNSLLFKTKDASDLSSKLENLFSNIPLQKRLILNSGRYYNENFSYSKLIEKYKNIIDIYE